MIALWLLACGSPEPAVEAGGAPVEAGGAPVEAGGAPAEAGGATVDAGGAPVEAGGAPVEAGGAPVEAGVSPAGPCDVAWAEIAAVRDAMAPLSPDVKAPDRERFLDACRALPSAVQPCLSMRVLADDPACRARIDGLPRATRESLEAALAPTPVLDGAPPPH